MKNKKIFVSITLLTAAAIIMGTYALIKAPALKPDPQPPASEEQTAPAPDGGGDAADAPPPIDGAELFDTAKYSKEPQISVYIAATGKIQTMALEKYLEGVVAREVDPNWPAAALAAQAVVSRTLTVYAIESGFVKRLRGADVSTAKEDLQAYAPEKINDNVREAVRETRGELLLYDGVLVNAIYSACNGQIAATGEESFPKEIKHSTPYFQPLSDTCYKYAPENIRAWTAKIPAAEIASIMNYQGNPANIIILNKGPSGRVLYFGAGGKKIHAADFRKAAGYDRLKSTLITEMTYDGKNFVFKGEGWGNGVGLCQWGAYTYALEGKSAVEILKHYYPGTTVKKMWE